MAHLIIEYTDNLKSESDIPRLLRDAADVLTRQRSGDGAVFPIGGVRVRAIELHEYHVADGREDYAFVHAALKIGAGRSESVRRKVCNELFDLMKEHFAHVYARRYLALSLELSEFDESGTWKHNNIHARFR